MNLIFLDNSIMHKAVQALSWTLIHSLWQGLLFTLIAGMVMIFTKKTSSSHRYRIIALLFFSFIGITLVTFLLEWSRVPQTTTRSATVDSFPMASVFAYQMQRFSEYFSANASLVVMIWFVVFIAKCVQMVGGLVYSSRIINHKIYQPETFWQKRLALFCKQLEIRRFVLLLESEMVKIPIVLGHLKPIILIPLGLLSDLPSGQVEAVLIHELAHIRRHDYFINLLQNIAETIFFFNPGLLWISGLLREERENCCDDIAVEQTKNKKQFISALISFKEYAVYAPVGAMAFPGRKNHLLQRVSRIIHDKNHTLNPAEKIFSLISLSLLTVLFAAAISSPVEPHENMMANQIRRNGISISQAESSNLLINPVPSNDESKVIVKDEAHLQKSSETEMIEIYRKAVKEDRPRAQAKKEEDIKKREAMETSLIQNSEARSEAMDLERQQALKDMQQAEMDRAQAMKDQEQAKQDAHEAFLDWKQAAKDAESARLDMAKAHVSKAQQDILKIKH